VAGLVRRDALARALREHLPDGWQFIGRVRGEMDYPTARALSDWSAIMTILGDACHQQARQVADRLEQAGLPLGWLPAGPDDPLLVAAFQGVRFADCR
jgi:hypothetical protein